MIEGQNSRLRVQGSGCRIRAYFLCCVFYVMVCSLSSRVARQGWAQGSGYRIKSLESGTSRVEVLGCRVSGLGLAMWSLGFRFQVFGFRYHDDDTWFTVDGFWFRV